MNNRNLNLWSFVTTNTTAVTIYKQATAGSFAQATNADLSTGVLYISIVYTAS